MLVIPFSVVIWMMLCNIMNCTISRSFMLYTLVSYFFYYTKTYVHTFGVLDDNILFRMEYIAKSFGYNMGILTTEIALKMVLNILLC